MQTLNLDAITNEKRITQENMGVIRGLYKLLFQEEAEPYVPATTLGSSISPYKPKGWLAGGAVRKTLLNQKIDSDFDLFFADERSRNEVENRIEAIFHVIKKTENELNTTYIVTDDWVKVMGIDAAEEARMPASEFGEIEIQVIFFNYYSTVENLLNSFDFTLCQVAIDDTTLYAGDWSLFDIANKRMVINEISFPVASLRRMFKYAQQGFYACTGTLTQFCEDIQGAEALPITKYID